MNTYLILSWTVCEKLISYIWTNFIRSKKEVTTEGIERVNKERIKKLEGRDFTASIIAEILELSDIIDHNLFRGIDDARKKRNAWLHSLNDIEDKDATSAMRTAVKLFQTATGVILHPAISRTMPGTGGVVPHLYCFNTDKN